MANGAKSVTIDLHPIHQQLLANLALLRASNDPKAAEAIKKLEAIEKQVKAIECDQMGIIVTFR